MDTPFYQLCKVDPQVQALLGGAEPRIYPFGQAPQSPVKPYAVYSTISGMPYNKLNCRPSADAQTLQVDVYSTTASQATAAAKAIRYAVELKCYVKRYNGDLKEPETQLYRVSMDLDFITLR